MSKFFPQHLAAFTIAVLLMTTFSFSAFAENPQCYKKIEGISLDQSVGDITNKLQQLGLHDITCKQRSKMPCAARKEQMMTYATNDQGSLHKVGDKLARLTFDNTGKPRSFAYEYYTDGPSNRASINIALAPPQRASELVVNTAAHLPFMSYTANHAIKIARISSTSCSVL